MSVAFGSITLSCVNDGADGRNGVGIASTIVEYAIGDSQTIVPEALLVDESNTVLVDENGKVLVDGYWTDEILEVPDGKYLWSRTITTFDDGSTSITYGVSKSGVGFVSEKRQYYLSNSSTTLSGGEWLDEEPYPIPDGKFMWGRFEFTMSDGSKQYSQAVYENSLSGLINKADEIEGKITQKVWQTDISSAIDEYDGSSGYSIRDRVAEHNVALNSITSRVSNVETVNGNITRQLTQVNQTANKINWLVKDGSSASAVELTGPALEAISENITLTGRVEFYSFSPEVQQRIQDIEDGVDGITLRDFTLEYGQSNSRSTQPSSWSTTVPAHVDGKYTWQKTTYTDKNGTRTEEIVCLTGQDGATGPAGPAGASGAPATVYKLEVSHAAIVKSTSGTYNPTAISLNAKSQTGTAALIDYNGRFRIETTTNNSTWSIVYPSGSGSDQAYYSYTIPANVIAIRCSLYAAGGYTTLLDQQTIPIVSDGAQGARGATGATGAAGADGEDAYTVILTNESHTFAGNASNALAGSAVCGVIAFKGATQMPVRIGTITGMPSGMNTPTITNNDTTSAKFTVNVTTSMTSANGVLTVPITVDSKSFTKEFSYSIAFKGATGPAGASGVGRTSSVVRYAISESATEPPIEYSLLTDSDNVILMDYDGVSLSEEYWFTEIPDVPEGMYLWTKVTDNYSDGSSTSSYSVSKQGDDAYTVVLTNETHTFAGDVSNAIAETVECGVIAYKGSRQVAAHIGSITDGPNGMTVSIANNDTVNAKFIVSVTTSMKESSGALTVPITVNGKEFTKQFTFTVAYKGSDAVSRNLVVTNAAVKRNANGSYTPSTITVSANQKSGSAALAAYSGRFKIETTQDFSTWNSRYTSSSDQSSYTFTIPANVNAVRFSLYQAGGTTVLLDQQTVPIVQDGVEGTGVISIEFYYCLSRTKPTTNPISDTTNWSKTPQTYEVGKKYWTCSVVHYTDGSTTTTEVVEDSGVNSANENANLVYNGGGVVGDIIKAWTKSDNVSLDHVIIDGGYLEADTIVSTHLSTNAIMSRNYKPYRGTGNKIAFINETRHAFISGTTSTYQVKVYGYVGRSQTVVHLGGTIGRPSNMTVELIDNDTINAAVKMTTTSSFSGSGTMYITAIVDGYTVTIPFYYSTSSSYYLITPSNTVIQKQSDGTFLPTTVDAINVNVNQSGVSSAYSGRIRIEVSTDNSSWVTFYSGTSNETGHIFRPQNVTLEGFRYVRFSLYAAGGFTTLLDQQIVPVLYDLAYTEAGTYLDLATGNFYSRNFTVINTAPANTDFEDGTTYMGPWRVSERSIWKMSKDWGSSVNNAAYFGDAGLSITDKFTVDATGRFTAESGKIGLWLIDDTDGYLKSSDGSTFISTKSISSGGLQTLAKFGPTSITDDGSVYTRRVLIRVGYPYGDSSTHVVYRDALSTTSGKELGVNSSQTDLYQYLLLGGSSGNAPWIAFDTYGDDAYIKVNNYAYKINDMINNAYFAFRRFTVNKNASFSLTRGRFYIVTFSHASSNNSSGAYWFMAGVTEKVANVDTYVAHPLIAASNVTITLTATTFSWNDTTNTPECSIYRSN